MGRQMMTKNNYGFWEASSAFQKAIRRGDEETALYFMVELFISGYDEYLWRRIKIIASEDVGLAEPSMAATIHALYQSYTEMKAYESKSESSGRPDRVFITHAVVALVRAPKSRLVDWLMLSSFRGHDEKRLEVPDYAYDKHTLKGKQMGRGIDHFYEEGSLLKNHQWQPGEKEAKDLAKKLTLKNPGKLKFEPMAKKRGGAAKQGTMYDEPERE